MSMTINRCLAAAVCVSLLALSSACSRGTRSRGDDPTGTSGQPGTSDSGDLEGTLEVEGRIRSYRLHVPPGHDASAPAALVVALHGGGRNAASLEAHIGMDAIADREGFLTVYPDGNGKLGEIVLTWNSGNCCGYALDEQVDDVAFLRALVGQLSTAYDIDADRVYANRDLQRRDDVLPAGV